MAPFAIIATLPADIANSHVVQPATKGTRAAVVASPGQVETQQNLFGPALARPGRPSPTTAPRGRTSSAKAPHTETATWGAWWKTLVLGNVAGTADVAMQNVTAMVTCGSIGRPLNY